MYRQPTLLSVFVVAFTLGLGTLAQASDDTNRANATKAEQDAFKHVKNKDWCKATNAFLDAYEYSPEVLYIYNAAKAAELAEDRKLALQLSLEMMGQFPSSDKQTEINTLIQKLSGELTSIGPGTACPRETANADNNEAEKAAVTPVAEPPSESQSTPDPAPAPAAAAPPPPPSSQPPGTAPIANVTSKGQNAGLFIGAGAGITALGAVVLGVSGLSYTEMSVLSAQHANEKQRLLESPSDETLLENTQTLEAQFTDEKSMYEMTLISGSIITTLGLASLGYGLYLKSQQPSEE